jgi:site-specific DNA-methyltransferase (adenine-specific)/modification methylase
VSLPKPYYDHGGITIYHGDCREILPLLGRFDLLLTDPPYGVAIDCRNKTRQRDRLRSTATRVWVAKEHALVHGDEKPFDPAPLLALADAHILWGANNYASKLPDSACWLAWDRKDRRAADSHITDVELAAVLGHRFTTVRIFRHMWAGFQRDSEVGARVLHPTQKPVALMSWCLGLFPDAKTVVDPYMGSGPVAKACKDRGDRYVGIELVEKYCEIAVKRLAQEVLFA